MWETLSLDCLYAPAAGPSYPLFSRPGVRVDVVIIDDSSWDGFEPTTLRLGSECAYYCATRTSYVNLSITILIISIIITRHKGNQRHFVLKCLCPLGKYQKRVHDVVLADGLQYCGICAPVFGRTPRQRESEEGEFRYDVAISLLGMVYIIGHTQNASDLRGKINTFDPHVRRCWCT